MNPKTKPVRVARTVRQLKYMTLQNSQTKQNWNLLKQDRYEVNYKLKSLHYENHVSSPNQNQNGCLSVYVVLYCVKPLEN